MNTEPNAERKPAQSFHPGTFIEEEMEARGWTHDELDAKLGFGSLSLELIISGISPVSLRTASDLSRVFGTSPDYWLNLQELFDKETDNASV